MSLCTCEEVGHMPPLNLIIAWLGAILGAYVLLFWIGSWWARRTPSDIDDVIVGVLQRPVVLILFLYAVIGLSAASDLAPNIKDVIARIVHVLLIGVISWGLWQLMHDTILYYGQQLAQRTESNFDDVLLPVLDVLAPVIIIGTGAILMLRLLGADISTVIMTAGGAALVVGLTLKDTLGNILGGLMLLIDTPFRFGDLVLWENTVCQIKRIGLRVTTLYNTEDHSDIFLPNTNLAAAKLANLTRPSPDLRVPVDVSIPHADRIDAVRAILNEVADVNPYVLGHLSTKIATMQRTLSARPLDAAVTEELRWGLVALRRERRVDWHLARTQRFLQSLLRTIRTDEKGGLSEVELNTIREQVNVLDAHSGRLKAAVRAWAHARTRDPQLRGYPDDRARIASEAEGRLWAYDEHLHHLRHHLQHPDLYESQRLDDLVVEFSVWLAEMFKAVTPAWKYPLVNVLQASPSGTVLRLWVYVDDIHLEGFVRRLRVTSDLHEVAAERLRELETAAAA
jgi:MscS family membrane protein